MTTETSNSLLLNFKYFQTTSEVIHIYLPNWGQI